MTFVLGRYLRLGRVLALHGIPLLLLRRSASGPARLKRLLEDAGATFVKLGQVLALQPDLVPRAYCDALFDLLDRVPPFPWRAVERVVREELGGLPDELFDSFERRPMASASVAQVHVASLAGRKLAVKVQRPDIGRSFEADMRLMAATASVLRRLRLRRWMWLARMLEEFVSWTREELDFRVEARYMSALAASSRRRPEVRVPELVPELSRRRVLVAELLDGPTVMDVLRGKERDDRLLAASLEARGFEAESFARNIVRNFVVDAFREGVFHADLHPANLLVLDDNAVGYVDFGITGALSPYARRQMVQMTLALTRGDSRSLLRHFLRIARTDRTSDLDAFRRGLEELIVEWFPAEGGGRRRRSLSYTVVMLEMLRLSRRTGVWPTPDAVRYLRSVITADGLIARFAPELDVSAELEGVCREVLEADLRRAARSGLVTAAWARLGARLVEEAPRLLFETIDRASVAAVDEDGGGSAEEDHAREEHDRLLRLVFTSACSTAGAVLLPAGSLATSLLAVAAVAGLLAAARLPVVLRR